MKRGNTTMTHKAYLHFGGAACGLPNGPFQTVAVEHKETELPRSGYTATGYGPRIATSHMVKWAGKWRRVYVANYGNSGTAYIGKPGNWLATVSLDWESTNG
jgi:hypothetical protein